MNYNKLNEIINAACTVLNNEQKTTLLNYLNSDTGWVNYLREKYEKPVHEYFDVTEFRKWLKDNELKYTGIWVHYEIDDNADATIPLVDEDVQQFIRRTDNAI